MADSRHSNRQGLLQADCDRRKSLLRFKAELSRIFFTPEAPINKFSDEYDNFWRFLPRYEDKMANASKKTFCDDVGQGDSSEVSGPFPCWNRPTQELLQRIVIDRNQRDYLKEEDVDFMRGALNTYMKFLEKQREKRANKLKEFQEGLPIAKERDNLVRILKDNQVVVVAGDTGCGKSTQVPRYLLEAGYEGLVVTQPRRLAAIALAARVSYEVGCELGSVVGYHIRFEKKTSKNTKLIFMTEGLLLRLLSTPLKDKDESSSSAESIEGFQSGGLSNTKLPVADPSETSASCKVESEDRLPLSAHQVIILDEVHERHLSCDLLIGLVKCLKTKRPELRIILMSATANLQLFSNYFDNCPVIQVPGRLYPVEIEYFPPDRDREPQARYKRRANFDPTPYVRVLSLIEQTTAKNERGDVLVFLSGAQEISTLQEALDGRKGWTVLPLYSALPLKQQDRVFLPAPEGVRKCILATNIAETSVTIDGVRFVIDSGKVKEMTYLAACRMQKLKEFWCSKASAQQRKGRAGRTGPGKCFRLYSEQQFEEMEDFSLPEIQRVPLHSLVLQLVQLGLADVRQFPFLESPPMDLLEHSICTLTRQGALTADESLTVMGEILTQLPVDLSVGKVLLLGCLFRELLEAALTLAAAMSVQNPMLPHSFRDYDMCRRRKNLENDVGDPLTIMRIYHEWLRIKLDGNESSGSWCRRCGIDEQRLYELTKLRSQFLRILKDAKLYDIPEAELTSSERMRRHGEIRQLRDLKRDVLRQEKQGRKRKWALTADNEDGDDHDEEDDEMDIKNIDFRLAQDRKTLSRLLRKGSELSGSERKVLLWLLAAGLYPQVAFSDAYNSYKKDTDLLFHTETKGFVTLHPNSVLALNPEALRLDDADIVGAEGGLSISSRHQMLAYISLLETTKPNLVGCVRLSTIHYILMLAGEIHTSPCVQRFVLDSIVELRIVRSSEDCRPSTLLLRVMQARLLFQIVFRKMLDESIQDDNENGLSPETRRLSRRLLKMIGSLLTQFTDIYYTQRRLLPADLKVIFTGEPHRICGFVLLGSLKSLPKTFAEDSNNDDSPKDSTKSRQETFECPECHEIHFSFASCATHLKTCILRQYDCSQSSRSQDPARKKDWLDQADVTDERNQGHFCQDCKRHIQGKSAFDILRHNRQVHQR